MSNKNKPSRQMTQLKQADLSTWKKEQYEKQNGICPILGIKIPLEDFVVDHQHRTKAEPVGENGAGMIRGAISRQANSWEGKVVNSFRRYGLHKFGVDICDALDNLSMYLRTYKTNLIHPSEKPKEPKITKTCYNKLVKAVNGKEKVPEFPKSGKLTKKLSLLFNKYNVDVHYYKEKK